MAEDEILLKDLEIIEDVEDTTIEETIQIVEVDGVELFSVETDDAFAALGEPNDDLKHSLLNDRDMSDQHPITAITGLREELDSIEALQTIYSDAKQSADYYEWNDDNVFCENRIGYFVTACEDVSRIKICEGSNIFGVTVDNAAFIGGQDAVPRDYKYGLVAHSGLVHVRCELDVGVGDFVVSNRYGIAEKIANDYGCKVIAIHSFDNVRYAMISLNISIDQMNAIGVELDDVDIHLNDLDNNVAAAVLEANRANQGVKQLQDEMENFEVEIKYVTQASKDAADSAVNTMDQYRQQIENAQIVSAAAAAIAQSAELSAVSLKEEAVDIANDTLAKANEVQEEVKELMNTMDPLVTWTSEDGKSGIAGFVAQADADRVTLASLSKWQDDESGTQSLAAIISTVGKHEAMLNGFVGYDGELKETIAQVEQKADDNGATITSLVSNVDKYSVGEYSQAYGLTRAQAGSILQHGYVYIPLVNHSETFADDGEVNEFTTGYSYVWNAHNKDWQESIGECLINSYPPVNTSNQYKYWYNTRSERWSGYEPHTLYIWAENEEGEFDWKQVNTSASNASGRITSMIRQTTNEIVAEVTNVCGDIAALNIRVGDAESSVQTMAGWGDKIATIEQKASDNEASIAQVVTDGKVNTASIVAAINDKGSSVNINGDHIVLNGATTNGNGTFAISTEGHMTATGGNIAGWSIGQEAISHSYTSGDIDRYVFMQGIPNDSRAAFGVYSKPKNSTDWQQQFYVTNAGYLYAKNAYVEGEIKSNVGNIGGWTISGDGISKTVGNYIVNLRGASTDPSLGAFYITDTTKAANANDRYPFVVSYNGSMKAMRGSIGGWTLNDTGLYKDTSNYSLTLRGNIATGEESQKGAIYITKKSDNSYPFLVRYDGYLKATIGDFSDSVTIGGTAITAGGLRKLYNAAAGKTGSDTFQIKRIEATSGSVGGWTIDQAALYSEGVGYKTFLNGQGFIHTYNTNTYPLITWQEVVLAVYASGAGDGSDLRLKHDVNHIDENYDVFFDSLKPKTFYYNDDAIGYDPHRMHFGFVAQDVLASQDKLGLNGLSIVHSGEHYRLQRQEIIALNTWQIQKAKSRITDLEARVEQLEKLLGEKGEK